MDWFKGNKERSYTKKMIKAIQKREKEESEIITIGRTTPEVLQKRAVENTLLENQKKVQKNRKEQKEEEQKTEDQLFVINNAKIKMGSHIGIFKVLNNTPTVQGKTVGTKIEKSPANFSFLDGFQILSVTGDWQDISTAKYQDNEALIKKSTLMVTGKMPPPNAPIETGKIEFIDSGQINIPENINTMGMPVPENEKPPRIEEIKLYTKDEKEIEQQNQIYTPLYGEPFCIEIKTENIVDGTEIEISIKDTDISIKSIVITSNKGKTELIPMPLKYYDESQENYDYEEHITTGKYKNFEFTFKIKNQPITSENNEIVPKTYLRNYEELIGLFSTENDNSKRKDTNYENKFINQNIAIKNICDEFVENILKKQNIEEITTLVQEKSKKMWEEATKQVQVGKLDDRPLYWARNKMQVALKRHYLFKNDIDFEKSIVKKNTNLEQIITIFEEQSRNYTGIDFSKVPKGAKKVLITGFDPFILNEFDNVSIKNYSPNIKQSNPSGVVALALQNNNELGAYIQTMIVPVRYTDFDGSQERNNGQGKGIIERYIKPFIEKNGEVDMIITVSQAGPNDYNIDVFATATRGGSDDNMNFVREEGSKSIIGGVETIKTTLPVQMTQGISRAIYHGKYKKTAIGLVRETTLQDIPKDEVYSGPGGNYLSNEIFYRVAKLREALHPKLPTGHFHISKIQGQEEDLNPQKIKELVIIVKQAIKEAIKGL